MYIERSYSIQRTVSQPHKKTPSPRTNDETLQQCAFQYSNQDYNHYYHHQISSIREIIFRYCQLDIRIIIVILESSQS